MISIRVQDCKQCGDISSTIEALDKKISRITSNLYTSLTLYAERKYSSRELKTLIRYKSVLNNLYYNGDYYKGYDLKEIISRVKSLV